MTLPIVLTSRSTSLGGNTSFEPFSVRICALVRPGRRIEKKTGQYNKKVAKVLFYFPLFERKPPLNRFDPKVAWWVMSAT